MIPLQPAFSAGTIDTNSSSSDRFAARSVLINAAATNGLIMQLAATRLVATTDTVASVAFDTGYASEAAFSRAFKKSVGQSPAHWRRERAVQAQENVSAPSTRAGRGS